MSRPLTPYLLSAPAAVLLLGLLLCPLLLLARVSLYESAHGHGFFAPGTWTASNYAAVTDGYGLSLLLYTFLFGVAVACLTLASSYAFVLFLRSLSRRTQRLLLAAVLLPKLASVLVILFGLQRLLPRGTAGALIAESFLIFPFCVLVLFSHCESIDATLEAAARGLGASAWQTFLRVTLPLSLPGLLLAGQLALVWGMGAFLGPLLLGGPEQTTLSVEIHRQAFEYNRWPRAAAAAVLLSATVAACLAAFALARRQVKRP